MTTRTWNGSNADWYTPGDWTPTGDPGSGDDVVINSGQANLVSGDAAIKVASISIGGGLLAIQDPGVAQSVSGNVSVSGSGSLQLDGVGIGGAGGSSMTIGGTLTNTSTNGSAISIGNAGITSADTLTVNGAGGLSNTGQLDIIGSASVQATLNVANAAAGFGTAGVETGGVFLGNNALLEFKSGQITTVNGTLELDGANARIADAGKLTSNSALTGLSSISGNFWLQNGASVSTTGDVSVTGNGTLNLDGNNAGGSGGSSLTIGGNLTNSSTNSNGVSIGTFGSNSADTLTVNGTGGLSNTGNINIQSSATGQSTLNVANAAAGFGTAGVETGGVFLGNNALLEFKSGQITTVNGTLELDGANARIADAGKLTSNSALTGLSSISGNFWLQNGASVSTTGDVSVTGNGTLNLDGNNAGGSGGSSLTIGGNLTNSSTNSNGVSIGTFGSNSADTLTVNGTGGLSNTGNINIQSSATGQSTLNVANAAAGFGTAGVETGGVFLGNNALLEFKSGQITTVNGTLELDGANARIADAGKLTSNSALTGLSSISGNFWLQNGASVSTTGDVSVTGNGTLNLDGNNAGGSGGSSLTIGGNLTNSSTNSNGVSIGTFGSNSADTLTVNGTGGLSNTGNINIQSSATGQSTLNVANAAAGFGTAGVETGGVFLGNNALLEFKSGQITTVNGTLELDGANARIADAGKLTSNSALTGLSSISGNFWLQNGASVSTTGDVSVTGNGTLNLDGNNAGGSGGSSLTIGGNLTNSSTNSNGVSIGTPGIASSDTLTVNGAGGLTNSGNINIAGGSASATANLVVANAVTSSAGTIFLNSFGRLTAASVNITGGTLEGTGTVTGALNDAGGTVVGGFLNATPGTLNVSGAYSQSGTGILQADINSGNAQQSSIIAVSGTPGTPGSPGSVNLAGGTLLIDAQSGLALNTPYTVMTFGANDLYGQFAQVQTEGTLGSHTGNGDSVNLGGGQTLEVLYNEASGDIQVEVVSTPASTTYTWDVGSGTWNASSGADWNPPGNGTTPSATSNVTIGAGGGGTVTLAQDQTIASLSITNGYTLSGSKNSITTTGNVSLASGATLSIDDMNVGGTFTDSGSATFAGVLTINGAGQFLLSNGSLTGGINGSGTFESVSGTTDTLGSVTIYQGTTFTTTSGATTDISSGAAIVNKGTFVIDGTSGNAIVNLEGNVTLSGGGAVILKTNGGTAFLRGSGVTLTNTNDTIEGAGEFGDSGALTIVNKGTINANAPGQNLNVGQGGGGVTNTGTLEATGGGTLNLFSTVTNTGGAITANGTKSVVNVDNTTVVGGTLNTASGGLLQTVGTSTLNGVTISSGSTYTTAGATTDLNTSLTNDGTFLINGSSSNAVVNLASNVTLSGGGTVTMEIGSATAFLRGSSVTLTNTNNTIQGAGNIGDSGALTIVNQAIIDANASGQNLNLSQGGGSVINTGTLEATGGGTLNIFSKVTNTGGAITANGGTIDINATITGGTLNATGTNVMKTSSFADLVGVTISTGSTYTTAGATTQLDTSLVNDGTFLIDGSSSNAIVNLGSNVTLSGGGAITMETSGATAFLRGNGVTLTNTNDTIQGAGNIGDSGALTIVNQATIDANSNGQNLNVNAGGGSVTNTGTLEATGGGVLNLYSTVTNKTGGVVTADGGTVNVIGTISGGTLNTLNGGVMESSGSSTDLSGVTISKGSTYTAGPGTTTQLNGAIVNDGTFAINGAAGNAIVNLGSNVTLSGGGKITMASSSSASAYLRGSGFKLTNSKDTIQGAGFIGDSGALALVNKATIDANSKGQNLNLNQGNGGVTNTKTIEATAGGVLQLFNTITNTGGTITASGKGSTVNVDDATIIGGTLTTTKGGLIQTVSSSDLNGVTISTGSTYTTAAGQTTRLDSSLVNDGTFLINGSAGDAIVNLGSNVTLSGGGAVTMKLGSGPAAFLRGSGVTLTNTNNTIQGAGNIGDSGALAFANEATVDANSSGQNLNVNGGNGGVTNTGTLEATGGGVLQLFNTITNTGGAVTASGTGSTVNVEGTIVGGTLTTISGGLMQTVSSADLNAVTISSGSTYIAGPGTTTQLNGAIANDGTFAINGASGNAIVNLGTNVTLSGGGTVTMTTSTGTAYLRGSGVTLTNTNDTIQGAGFIGDSGALAINNGGTIDANSSGQNLNLGQGGGALTNTGTFEATSGGHLFVAQALSGAGQLKVGANSTVELGGATSENTTFLSATAATLLIDNATTTSYTGVLNSFAKGDILELGNTNATSATPTSFNGTDTTLTVDLSSGGPLTYKLAGNLTGDTFSVTHSGSNSSIAITAPAAFAEAYSLLSGPIASTDSSGVFGAPNTAGGAQLDLAPSHAHS